MVRAIARALMRNGHSESGAISLAIGAVKRWARGGGKVHPSTRARAAAAVAHWEAIKASSGRSDEELIRAASGQPAAGAYAAGHPFFGNQWGPGNPGGIPVGGPGSSTKAMPKPSGGGGKGGGSKGAGKGAGSKGAGSANAAATAAAKQQSLNNAVDTAKNSYDRAKKALAQAQQHLANAKAQQAQDLSFAQARLASASAAEKNTAHGITGTASVTAAQQQIARLQLSTAAMVESAQNGVDNATMTLHQSQQSLLKAMKAAGFRQDGHEIVLRDWATWDAEHRPLGHALHLHKAALRYSDRVMDIPTRPKLMEASDRHLAAAGAFHHLFDQHAAAGEFQKAVEAQSLAKAHTDIAAKLRLATADMALDQHEEKTLTAARIMAKQRLEAYQGERSGTRDGFVGEGNPAGTGDSSGASLFLPAGPSKKQAKTVQDVLSSPESRAKHRFEGGNLGACAKCGKPIGDRVHQGDRPKRLTIQKPGQPIPPVPREAQLVRHAGPGHHHVPTGHIKGSPARHAKAAQDQALRHFVAVEGPLTAALKAHFNDQRHSVLSRLQGDRGKRMLKRAAEELAQRAGGPNEPPEIPPEDSGETPPPASIVGPSAIFDASYWTGKTAEVLGPHLQTAGNLAADSVKDQILLDPMHDDSTSLGKLHDVVTQRAQAAAHYISGTTAKALTEALQSGVANHEGIPAIAKRVNAVFDNADIVRAKRIAQTEVVGAYNEGAHAYAAALPSDVIGTRRWLAHHDDRTRPTHRLADGQEQPMGAPFWVGGSAMLYPGDKAAPVGEWINCRCSQAFLPPGMAYGGIAAAAEAYVAGLKAKPPTPVSAVDVSHVEP